MKILCDVCGEGEASFYCSADEASLCTACDHRVHHANKLAGKHHRFSLLPPSPKHSPLCDICQERRALLFCQQDRAILCRECDIPIHKANEHTQKHSRFLLTGVRISGSPSLYSESPAESASSNPNKPATSSCTTPPAKGTTPHSTTAQEFSTSSISEYLIEMLPGWHVEDLLDSSSPPNFCKSGENDLMLPFWDGDLSNSRSGFPTENMGFWVPQVQVHQNQDQNQNQSSQNNSSNNNNNVAFELGNGCRDIQFKEFSSNSLKSTRKRSEDNSFAVPQITPLSIAASKRSKTFW